MESSCHRQPCVFCGLPSDGQSKRSLEGRTGCCWQLWAVSLCGLLTWGTMCTSENFLTNLLSVQHTYLDRICRKGKKKLSAGLPKRPPWMSGKLEPVSHSINPFVTGEGRVICRTTTLKIHVLRSLVVNTVECCSGKADFLARCNVCAHTFVHIVAALWLADVGCPEGCPESNPYHF